MGDSPNIKRSDLLENLCDAEQVIARAHIESHGAPPEALEVVRCSFRLGPVSLVFGCRASELREVYRALQVTINEHAVSLQPTAESVARVAVSLRPLEAIAWSEGIQAGPLAGLLSRLPLQDEPPEFAVRIRGEDAAEAERRLAWLLGQAGLPHAAPKGRAA